MVPRIVKFTETESRMVVARDSGGVGSEELLFNGYRVSVLQDEKVLEMNGNAGCTKCECTSKKWLRW